MRWGGFEVTGDEVLLQPELHGAPVDGRGHEQQPGLGAEDGQRGGEALTHTPLGTGLALAGHGQEQ